MPVFGGKTTRIIILGLIVLGVGSIWGACRFVPKRLSICEVQGNGEISRFVGKNVTIQGIVSAQLEGGIPAGFFLVDRNCPVDDGSSQGIFVEGDNFGDFVHLGDELRVKGLVKEVGGETRIKCDQSEVEILSLGNDLPPGINLVEEFLLDPDSFQYEKWEGMLVSFPEGEFLKGFTDSDLPRILPLFDLDPILQMVCLQDQSITLQLSSSQEFKVLENLSNGDLVQNPVGILRQNTSGYLLDLIAGYDFKVVGRKASPGLMDGSVSAELLLTETQDIFTSGTPSVITTGTPAGTLIPSATIIPSLTFYPVHLLISEFYPNPTGKEPDGEWVEIYNPKPYSQPLTGIKLGDETSPNGNEGMLRFPDGYFIDSQEVLVVARQAKAFYMEFGFLPDFEMEDSDAGIPDLLPYSGWGRSGIQFSNNGDEVLMLDPWDRVVDLLVYGNSTAGGFSEPLPAPKEGNSLERYPPENDRDRGGDWREREGVSPGRLDRSPPTQAVLPTQEPSSTIASNPSPVPSGTASISPTKSATTMCDATLTPTMEIFPSLTPTLTITNTVTPAPEPSLPPMMSPTPSPPLTGTVEITQFPSITLSSSLTYTPHTTISLTTTETLIPVITTTSTEVVTGTPLPSITPSQPPTITGTMVSLEDLDILLNEIHADPDLILGDANNDGQIHSDDDEFLEFVNIGENDLDLSGWSISDSLRPRYIFPDGTILKVGCAVVVFGGGDPQGDFGGSLIFRAGSLGLNNSGDAISLCDESGEERLFYQFGLEGGENQSLTRSPDIMGALPLVLHGEVEGSNGDLYSPGVMLGGSVFEDCP
jgi:hypothetical protein